MPKPLLHDYGSVSWCIAEGDCIEVMTAMDEASVDAIVTDPPYGLGFMGVAWDTIDGRTTGTARRTRDNFDHTGGNHNPIDGLDGARTRRVENQRAQEWHGAWAREALRVLKPGGRLVSFGGTRTYHRLVCGIEDAGFEVRDQLDWLFGSGFPKSKACLKPGHEPIVLARKPDKRSGPLNIDACRIGTGEGDGRDGEASAGRTYEGIGGDRGFTAKPGVRGGSAEGRWPANVILDEGVAAMLDEQTGALTSGRLEPHHERRSPRLGHGGVYGDDPGDGASAGRSFGGDTGGASRFFYVAKPDSTERHNAGRNPHPTVKPIALMQWLIRLVTPEGGVVLDPFTGSGTTGIAAMREGRTFIGIEREPEYVDVARARIIADSPLLNTAAEAA